MGGAPATQRAEGGRRLLPDADPRLVITRSTSRPEAISRARSIPGSSPQSSGGVHHCPPQADGQVGSRRLGKFAPFVHQHHVVGAAMPLRPFFVTTTIGRLVEQGGIRRLDRLWVHAEPLHPGRAVVALEGRGCHVERAVGTKDEAELASARSVRRSPWRRVLRPPSGPGSRSTRRKTRGGRGGPRDCARCRHRRLGGSPSSRSGRGRHRPTVTSQPGPWS